MSNPNPDTRYASLATELRRFRGLSRNDRLRFNAPEIEKSLLDAALALDTLIAENARLRRQRDSYRSFHGCERADICNLCKEVDADIAKEK